MNRRQKKKQYKKRYGYNPIKGPDGRYQLHTVYGIDLASEVDCSGKYTPEQIEALQEYNLKPEDIERMTSALMEGVAMAMEAMADFALAVSKAFADMATQYRKQMIGKEELIVVVTRHLEERRKCCGRKRERVKKRRKI